MLPLAAGCLLGIIGEIFKIICVISSSPSQALNYYVLYSLVTDLAPCLFLTSVGWMVRRMIEGSATPACRYPWPARIVSQQIITLEICAFSLQSYGLLVQANPLLSRYWALANLVTVLGSAVEILNVLAVWLSLLIVTRRRPALSISSFASSAGHHQQSSTNFSAFAKLIAASVGFVFIRTLSRLALHVKNAQLEPFKNELLIFLLEGLPLSLCALFLIVFHPCRFDGGIRDQTPSFFSPEVAIIGGPTGPTRGGEMEEQQSRQTALVDPLKHASDFHDEMGPFWTVPLSPQQHQPGLQTGMSKRPSAHVRLVEPEGAWHPRPPAIPAHRRSVSESKSFEPTSTAVEARRSELDITRCRQPSQVEEELRSPAAHTDGRHIRRRTHSAVSFDKNPLGIAEFHADHEKSPRRSPYSISSYYDGASKNL